MAEAVNQGVLMTKKSSYRGVGGVGRFCGGECEIRKIRGRTRADFQAGSKPPAQRDRRRNQLLVSEARAIDSCSYLRGMCCADEQAMSQPRFLPLRMLRINHKCEPFATCLEAVRTQPIQLEPHRRRSLGRNRTQIIRSEAVSLILRVDRSSFTGSNKASVLTRTGLEL